MRVGTQARERGPATSLPTARERGGSHLAAPEPASVASATSRCRCLRPSVVVLSLPPINIISFCFTVNAKSVSNWLKRPPPPRTNHQHYQTCTQSGGTSQFAVNSGRATP